MGYGKPEGKNQSREGRSGRMTGGNKIPKSYIIKLWNSGKSKSDICKETGIPYYTVHGIIQRESEIRHIMDYRNRSARPGWNLSRKKCRACAFRPPSTLISEGANCGYILTTGHSRGSEAEDCDRYYERRQRLKIGGDNDG